MPKLLQAAAVGTYSSAPNVFVADGNPGATATDTIVVPDHGAIHDLNVRITLQHPQTGIGACEGPVRSQATPKRSYAM